MTGRMDATGPTVSGTPQRGGWFDVWPFLLVALVIRLPGLASRPLWYDEAFAVLFSREGLPAMLYGTLTTQGGVAADVHPLGYYSLLYLWGLLFGTSPLAVRSLSVLLGTASIFVAYHLALELFDRSTARWTALALAFAPFPVHYAQEVRMYALLALLVMGAAWFLVKAIHQPERVGIWVGFGLCAAAAQYTHNLAFVYLLPISMVALATRKRGIILRTVLAGIGAIFLYLPWLLQLPDQFARLQWAYWLEAPGWTEVLQLLVHYTGSLPAPAWALPIQLFVSLLSLCLALLIMARSVQHGLKKARQAGLILWLSVAPPVFMVGLSIWQPVFLLRALLPAAMFFTMWIVWCFRSALIPVWVRRSIFGLLALSYAVGLYGWFSYQGFPYAPFETINVYLRANVEEGDTILHSNKLTALPARYTDPELNHTYLADAPGSASDTLARATQEVLGFIAVDEPNVLLPSSGDVWLIMFQQEEREYQELGAQVHPVRAALEESLTFSGQVTFGDVVIYHYQD